MSLERVLDAIPHRPPFLWVDEVLEQTEDSIRTRKVVDPNAPFFRGHYPEFPITPGVLVCEAIFQSGAILLSERARDQLAEGKVPVLTKIKDGRFKAMVRPGDTLEVEVQLDDTLKNVFSLRGKAKVGGKLAVGIAFSVAVVDRPAEWTKP